MTTQLAPDLGKQDSLSPTPKRLLRLLRANSTDIRGRAYARATPAEQEALAERIADLTAAGWNTTEIAKHLHYSDRHVRRILKDTVNE